MTDISKKRKITKASGELPGDVPGVLRGGEGLDPWNLIRVMPAQER